MAKKMRRFLALVIALALCAGQIAVPAMAEEATPEAPSVTVSLSQAPAPSENMDVQVQDPVTQTTHDTDAGIITDSTSTTTTWTGTDENGNAVTGSETITDFVGTDDYTGSKLLEGGSVTGSETTTIQSETSESTIDTIVTEEVTTTIENKDYIAGQTQTHTDKSSQTTEGQWVTGSDVTEGDYIKTGTEQQGETTTDTIGLGGIPEGGITIQLTPNGKTQNPYDFNGEVSGEIIPLDGAMEIPEGAVLRYDNDGNIIGYTLITESEAEINSKEEHGEAEPAGTETDTTADISVVTPDLDVARNDLGILNDNSVITEEYDPRDPGKINAYIVTNTEKKVYLYEHGMDALEKPADSVTTDETGITTTVTSEDVTDEDGNVIGYATRKVITDANGKVIQDATTTQTILKNDPPAAAEDVITFTLPAKPEESTATDENGITTTVTVEEIVGEGGDVIGYKAITVITDEEGNELSRGSESIFGTTTTESESVKLDNNTAEGGMTVVRTTEYTYRITAEEAAYEDIATYTRLTSIVNDISTDRAYEMVEIDGKLYWIFAGSMNVTEGEGHGDTSLMQPITPESYLMNSNSDLDLSQGGNSVVNNTGAPEEGFKYIGYGVNPSLNVNYNDVTQFRLKSSDGKTYYALCIDLDTGIKNGHLYDITDITSEDYYQQSGSLDISSAEKIRSVALNGYWGTASDVGSMDEVKAFLKSYLQAQNLSEKKINEVLNSLTPGQALAATQAALWKFGNKSTSSSLNENNLISNGSDTDKANAKYLFNALLAAANDPNVSLEADEGVEFLDAADITGGAITIKSKVVPAADAADHANTDADPANDVYNTDLSFTLGIEPSKLNGDLIVTVTVDGREVKKVRLAGENALLPLGRITADENGVYTITDVELAEGVSVNLNLSGTQDLGTGVYIYTSLEGSFNDSQTLVTLATGERKVNLDMNMNFQVEEPTATKTSYAETEYGKRTDTRVDTRTDTTERKEVTTKSESEQTVTDVTEGYKTYYADVTVTKVTAKEAKEERSWFASWLKTYAPDPVPYHDEIPEHDEDDDDEDDILDEEVPLAAAPKTGDISYLWAAISLISLGGAALLARKKENA